MRKGRILIWVQMWVWFNGVFKGRWVSLCKFTQCLTAKKDIQVSEGKNGVTVWMIGLAWNWSANNDNKIVIISVLDWEI